MIKTPALLIVTTDDFPVGAVASRECTKLVRAAVPGHGRHFYGGRHYAGHHVVFKKWQVAKSLRTQRAINEVFPA